MAKRLIEAGPEIEMYEVITSGNVTLEEDIEVEVEVEETPAPAKRISRAKSSVKKTPAPSPAYSTVTSGRPSRRKPEPMAIPEVHASSSRLWSTGRC